MKNVPLLIATVLGTLLLVVGAAVIFSGQDTTQSETAAPVAMEELVTAAPHVKGATESAQVTVVEFSDFQCPACKSAEPLVQQLLTSYPDEVEFVYRHLPLDTIHPNARPAAAASEVAAEFGKFWEMHQLLFASQEEWAEITNRGELNDYFVDLAVQLEIDENQFREKLEDPSIAEKVQEDAAKASELNLAGTPTFFVNGSQVSARQLSSAVEEVLGTQ